jgi:hypothetical protein
MAIVGDLADLGTPDLLYLIKMRGMTGELFLRRGDEDARLSFEGGRLVHVTSSLVSQRLGELLVHLGKLTEPQLDQALADQALDPTGPPLGARLVDQGMVDEGDLAEVLTCQAEEILYRVLAWPDGGFTYTTREVTNGAVPLPEINVERIVLDAIRLADEYETMRARIPSLDCEVVVHAHGDDVSTPPLTLKESIVIASIERGARTLYQVAEATRLAEVELIRLVDDLLRRDLLEIVGAAAETARRRTTGTGSLTLVHRADDPTEPLAELAKATSVAS